MTKTTPKTPQGATADQPEEPACRCNRRDHEHVETCPAYCAEDSELAAPQPKTPKGATTADACPSMALDAMRSRLKILLTRQLSSQGACDATPMGHNPAAVEHYARALAALEGIR